MRVFIAIFALFIAIGPVRAESSATREPGRNAAGSGGAIKPTQNSSCDKAEAAKCQAETRKKLDLCPYSELNACRANVMLSYSMCKRDLAQCR